MGEPTDNAALRRVFDALPSDIARPDELADARTQSERRRTQNRLNQRALRKRERESAGQKQRDGSPSRDDSGGRAATGLSRPDAPDALEAGRDRADHKGARNSLIPFRHLGFWDLVASSMSARPVDRRDLIRIAQRCPVDPDDMPKILDSFKQWMYAVSASASPARNTLFTLVQFNVFRALDSNARQLFLPPQHALEDDSESYFTDPRYVAPLDIPPPLRPTHLQRTARHHPWIDLLPVARMRDNLIRAGETYDEEELCTALMGCSIDSENKTGVVCWGEAWDPAGWELTEEFLETWAWTVSGCDELLRSTNQWRRKRGKEMLKLDAL